MAESIVHKIMNMQNKWNVAQNLQRILQVGVAVATYLSTDVQQYTNLITLDFVVFVVVF